MLANSSGAEDVHVLDLLQLDVTNKTAERSQVAHRQRDAPALLPPILFLKADPLLAPRLRWS